GNDSFTFSVQDDTGTPDTGTFSITVTEGAATAGGSMSLNVNEGSTQVIDSTMLAASADVGDPASELVYTVTAGPSHGDLFNTFASSTVTSFTQQDIDNGYIEYRHNSTGSPDDTADSFDFSVVDDTGTPDTGTFNITITEGAATAGGSQTLSVN